MLGFFDPPPASASPTAARDFGQTLARWGWKRSRYLELPLLGPRTLRDALGNAVEAPLSPLQQIEEDRVRVFLQGLQLVDLRTNLFAADSPHDGADDYRLTRDAWLQRRNYQIGNGSRTADDAAAVPAGRIGRTRSGREPAAGAPAPQPAH